MFRSSARRGQKLATGGSRFLSRRHPGRCRVHPGSVGGGRGDSRTGADGEGASAGETKKTRRARRTWCTRTSTTRGRHRSTSPASMCPTDTSFACSIIPKKCTRRSPERRRRRGSASSSAATGWTARRPRGTAEGPGTGEMMHRLAHTRKYTAHRFVAIYSVRTHRRAELSILLVRHECTH